MCVRARVCLCVCVWVGGWVGGWVHMVGVWCLCERMIIISSIILISLFQDYPTPANAYQVDLLFEHARMCVYDVP